MKRYIVIGKCDLMQSDSGAYVEWEEASTRIAELELTNIDQGLLIAKQHNRIAELEAENAQCKEAFAAVSEGKPMGPIVEKHLIENMQKALNGRDAQIVELQAENLQLRDLIKSMGTGYDDTAIDAAMEGE